uniref:Reverse transcriptase Ty1/copia-type domain-containing protein n=1 Tax=Solanum lycopersicum TaxID=4081 RepID=A0A3Q7HMW1_SOLLC
MLICSSFPERFLGEASLIALYTINRFPSSVLGNMYPYERLYKVAPNYTLLKVFGSACFVLLQPHEHTKLEPHASSSSESDICPVHESSTTSNFHDQSPIDSSTLDITIDLEVSSSSLLPNNTSSICPEREKNPSSYLRIINVIVPYIIYMSLLHTKEASSDPFRQQAMKEELLAFEKTHTWDLVEPLFDKTRVNCKWIYNTKTPFYVTQEYGIDCEETFAPVARVTSVLAFFSIAAAKQWGLSQMNVKNAFINKDLVKEVYLKNTPRYDCPPNKVRRLHCALYSLKQCPQAWYYTSPFIPKTTKGIVLLILYVDDMIITSDDTVKISEVKNFLSTNFEMKDLGSLNYFMGIEVLISNNGISLYHVKLIWGLSTIPWEFKFSYLIMGFLYIKLSALLICYQKKVIV